MPVTLTVDYPSTVRAGDTVLVKATVTNPFDFDLTATITITHGNGEADIASYCLPALSPITHGHSMVMPEGSITMNVKAEVFGADMSPVASGSVDITIRLVK